MENCSIRDIDTVDLSSEGRELIIIDQTLLPGEIKFLRLQRQEDIREAIFKLRVRGAPAIGVAAAIGIYLAALEIEDVVRDDRKLFDEKLSEAANYLKAARPTAVNLSWAVDRMLRKSQSLKNVPLSNVVKSLRLEAEKIKLEDIEVCRKIGENGLTLLKPGQGVLTHCNAGHLAAVRYGTATAPIYLGNERGYNFRVFADETRPLLQGARLTVFELEQAGIDVTLICDNMAASVMKQGKIDAVITGCDRIAANGDAANKIGTLGVAILAKRFDIPFYIAAPSSTIDMQTPTGNEIVIEERDVEEIRSMWYERPVTSKTVKIYNPAFDVTDNELITGIITEYGIAYPPYDNSLKIIEERKLKNEKINTSR